MVYNIGLMEGIATYGFTQQTSRFPSKNLIQLLLTRLIFRGYQLAFSQLNEVE